MSFLRELHQRLNQANSAAGWPAVLDFDDHDEMSNTIATVLSARVSELDSNPLAQALAGEKIREVIRPHDDVEIDLDTRWCTQYDETDLFAARLIAVVYRTDDAYVRVPLSDVKQWREVATAHLDSETICQAHIQPDCGFFDNSSQWIDLQPYPIKRGEHLALVWMCAGCRERLKYPYWTIENAQIEPTPWIDEGPNFDGDPWA